MGEMGDNIHLEDGDSSFRVILQKFKRKKVSAVCDFPPRCAQKALIANSMLSETAMASYTSKDCGGMKLIDDALEVGAPKTHINSTDCQSGKLISEVACLHVSVKKEYIGGPLDGDPSRLKDKEIDLQSVENLAGDSEPTEVWKSMNGLELNKSLADDAPVEGLSASLNSHPLPMQSVSVVDTVTKIHPYQRISVTQEFPPFCGPSAGTTGANVKQFEVTVQQVEGCSHSETLKEECRDLLMQSQLGSTSSEIKVDEEQMKEKSAEFCHQGLNKRGQKDVGDSEENVSKKVRIHTEAESVEGKFSRIPDRQNQLQLKGPASLELASQGLVNAPSSPGMLHEGTIKTDVKSCKSRSEAKGCGLIEEEQCIPILNMKIQSVSSRKNYAVNKSPAKGKVASRVTDRVVVGDVDCFNEDKDKVEVYHKVDGSSDSKPNLLPLSVSMSGSHGDSQEAAVKPGLKSFRSRSIEKGCDLIEEEKHTPILRTKMIQSESPRKKSTVNKSPAKGKAASQVTNMVAVGDVDCFIEDKDRVEDYYIVGRSSESESNLLPPSVSMSGDHGDSQEAAVTRVKVRETLRFYQAICRKMLKEEEAKPKKVKKSRKNSKKEPKRRIDFEAGKILKDKGKFVNTDKKIVGPVPGVEVGDEFMYRMELLIIGLHRQVQGGIDTMKVGAKIIATSIVASGGYDDDLENSDKLIYTGSGGNAMCVDKDKEPEDQKLVRGNLALRNSISEKNPVRVIRGFKESKASGSSDARGKIRMNYTYDGLYLVHKYWQEMGQHGKLVFQFQLNRIPGQPELAWKEVKKSSKSKVREGLCMADVSQGKELMPIWAVNTINEEKPPQFTYITSMIYPNGCKPTPPAGCDCVGGCSDSKKCSCAVKNGEIPYNHNGAIVEAKPLVYECGPSCGCPPSCHNRVSQHGIKFQLEIFKTKSRGWGVRSLNSIPSGSFICEYIGELLEDKEAEQRTGNDEYLFDIGQNDNDHSLWSGLSNLMPDSRSASFEGVEDGGFTIDAARLGNVGRFINHSCSPNLYAQDVLYDHSDKRMPHIMLFAAENIPPLQELSYHYNYKIDQVRDSNGNIKKKSCYCGSSECTGRMY